MTTLKLEGLKVLPPQGVEQIGADNETMKTASQTGIKRRMSSPRTLCEPHACLSRVGGACEDPST